MGSFIAQQLAVTHPEKVDRLILVAGIVWWKRWYTAKPSNFKNG